MGVPTNIVDAASALKDGKLGIIEIIKIGDLVVSALTGLYASDEMMITEKPIETGMAITDAAVKLPAEIVLEVCFSNPDLSIESGVTAALSGDPSSLVETWRDKRDELFSIFNNREIVEVATHDAAYESMMITSIVPWYDVDENYDAYFASITLREIQQIDTGGGGGLLDKAKDAVGSL